MTRKNIAAASAAFVLGSTLVCACATTAPEPPRSITISHPDLGADVVIVGDGVFVFIALPAAHARLQEAALQLRETTTIIVHDDVYAFVKATGQTAPSLRAWSTFKTVHLLPPSTWSDPGPIAANKRLAHELCHVALWQAHGSEAEAVQARLPRFVVEGVCSVVADQGDARQPREEVLELARAGRTVNFDDDAAFSYGFAHHVFAAVLACRGWPGIKAVVDDVGTAGVVGALGKSPLQWLEEPCP
ncbi:MAG: hypothetical protein Q8O67_27320 [Deltaproteobacteria bacterium]|nr:hypothetical protein [Deltaproteobacteria bacterium]